MLPLLRLLAVWGCALLGVCSPLAAQFFLNGSARALNDSCYQLTPATNWMVGSIWNPNKIDLRQSFDLVMQVNLGCSDLMGADGMVFGLQPVSTSVGEAGGGIGFGGVVPSLGVEIDTYQNPTLGDPFFDHLAIIRDGNLNHSGGGSLAGPVQARLNQDNIEDCRFYDLRISWDAAALRFEVYFDCQLRLSYTGDIVANIFGGDPLVFWGFTSATGGLNNDHRVCFSYTTFLDQLADVVLCPGGQISLQASGGLSYEWSPAAGLSDTRIPNPIANPDTTTTYRVRVTDACNRPFFDEVTVTVAGNPVFFDLGPDTTVCAGQDYALDATTPTATYRWSNGATTPTLPIVSAGLYAVTVTRTDTVCTAEDQVRVDLRPPPFLDLGPDTTLCLGQRLLLQASFPEAQTTWQNGSTADTFAVDQPGRYLATLTHPCGLLTDQVSVRYEDCRQVFMPNVFSPNDDGLNDRFYPQHGGDVSEVLRLEVFDRWGGQVFLGANFPASEASLGWRGDYRGQPAQPGVYTWILEVRFRDGFVERRAGEVTLLR